MFQHTIRALAGRATRIPRKADRLIVPGSLSFLAFCLWLSASVLSHWQFWAVALSVAGIFFLSGSRLLRLKLLNQYGRIKGSALALLASCALAPSFVLVALLQFPLSYWWASFAGANLGSIIPIAYKWAASRPSRPRTRKMRSLFRV